jgi:hypothetical protein
MKKVKNLCVVFLMLSIALSFISCATGRPRNIDEELIAALKKEKRTVHLKINDGEELYTIDPLTKKSANGCPMALITGWKGPEKVEEKEVEVCK